MASANDGGSDDHEHDGTGSHYRDMLDENRQHIRDNQDEMEHNREDKKDQIHANKQSFESEQGHVKQFFKTGLNDTDKAAIKSIIENFQSDREALMDSMKQDAKGTGSVDMTGYNAQFATLRATYYTALKSYVDPAKMDAYNVFVAARNEMVLKNMDIREETWNDNKDLHNDNKDIREENRGIKTDRWEAMKQKFTQMSEDKLNVILSKIETVKSKINNDVVSSLLDDLKSYIQGLLQ